MTPAPANSPSATDPSTERFAARSAERELRSRFPLGRATSVSAVAVAASALSSVASALASVATAVAFSSLAAS